MNLSLLIRIAICVAALIAVLPFSSEAHAQTNCVAQAQGELTTSLSWTNIDTVTTDTVNILRSTSTGTETVLINIPYGASYVDTIPAPTSQITYYYEIQAKGPGGLSPASNEVCKTFFPGPPAPVGAAAK